jgi:hypothetical protein
MLLGAPVARAQVPDSTWFRIEVGASSDVTNERFVEETYDDTTFTGTRTTGSPEFRNAGLLVLDAAGALRGARYQLRQEAVAGDHLLRSYSRFDLTGEPRDGWRASFAPELDLRRDRSFGDDRREARFRPEARVRATSLDHRDTWDVALGGEWARTSGTSEALILDRDVLRGTARWAHAPYEGLWESEVSYGLDHRAFPDSASRDHLEQHGQFALRRLLPRGGFSLVEVQVDRRTPRNAVVSTRDRFWSGRGDLSASVPLHDRLRFEFAAGFDGYRYDVPDTSVYFDYALTSVRPSLRWSFAHDWSVRIGPRFDWLVSPRVASERYRQVSVVLEAERMQVRDWWSFTPSFGWRDYDLSASVVSLDEPDLNSSYVFLEGDVFAEVALPVRARLRVTGSGRWERHEDPTQDATSLYLALDVRRGF